MSATLISRGVGTFTIRLRFIVLSFNKQAPGDYNKKDARANILRKRQWIRIDLNKSDTLIKIVLFIT
jgi:hypothetical protein